MGLRMIYIGLDSAHGFQSKVLQKIDKQLDIEYCLLVNKQHDNQDNYDSSKYFLINYDLCEHNRYDELCDFNTLEPLDKLLIESMKLYESDAIRMLGRNMEHDVYTYDECRRLYFRHLQFWNHMITANRIQYAVINETPHHTHEYIIYALCKVKGIPMNVNISTNMLHHWLSGDKLFGLGEEIYETYQRLLHNKSDITLTESTEHMYQAFQYGEQEFDERVANGGMSRKGHINYQKETFLEFIRFHKILWRNFNRFKYGVGKKIKRNDKQELEKQIRLIKEDLLYVKRAKLKMKSMRDISYYNKLAKEINWSDKYLIYFLHFQPEASTLPKAGVFNEQELILRILAKSLEGTGIKLYVKEHFVQPYRHQNFYDDIAGIKGIQLIHSDINSKKLLKHAVAVGTCTGTVIMESIINQKPILVFGDGGFTRGPGIYYVQSVRECKEALNTIVSGMTEIITEKKVRTYLKAIEEETYTVTGYIDQIDAEDENEIVRHIDAFAEMTINAWKKSKGELVHEKGVNHRS